ncbi:MAG TPA: DUF192 domain-containing protein [Rhodanobacteraceae bacterium]|nr:DUF192 domain-containing protein [Rhodanobacteraceae bacterium]
MLLTPLLLALAQAATPATAATTHIAIDGHQLTVEVAADNASREHGLMGRTALEHGHGMLFVFPDDAPRWFWMKNTLIPLDILFFGSDARLVSMQLNVPPCTSDPCPSYASNADAKYVVELPAGAADRLHIHQGDTLKLPAKTISAR